MTARLLALLVAPLLLALAPSATPAPVAAPAPLPRPAPEASMIRYQLSFPDRQAHRVDVRLEVDTDGAATVDVSMPVWTPGSYLVREFAKNVLDLTAEAPDGGALAVQKVDKNTWRVSTGGAERVAVTYTLHANERSVRTNHVDEGHAFLSPAATFLRVDGREAAPHRIEFELPEGWGAFSGLEERDGGFTARDYDLLVDSPFELGPHEVLEFEHDGVPHYLVLAGENDLDREKFVEDVRTIVAEVASVFGTMPFERYTFLLLLVDQGGGGLEHLDSSVCMGSRWGLHDPKRYRGFLSLIAHEYFHAWNVKRFRPVALGPFDYDRENYTPDLWVCEGVTSYYDDLCTLRAGFYDKPAKYLSERADAWRKEAERPGSQRMSLAQSSHDAWIKLYRPDDNSTNSSISYYSKGALVALQLDLRIRRLTGGRSTLATALRIGWEQTAAKGEGFPERGMEAFASEAAGEDLTSWFDGVVRGTDPLAPNDDLRWVGMELKVVPKKNPRDLPQDAQGFPLEPSLGITTRSQDGFVRVDNVLEGGAAWHAGLQHDDLVVAVDDLRVSTSTLGHRLERAAGGPVELVFLRDQTLHRLTVQPDQRRLEDWKLAPLEEVTDEQAAAYEEWTGFPHPSRPQEDEAAGDAQDGDGDGEG